MKDYDNGLKRMDGFAAYLDRVIARMREGIKSGVVETKLTTKIMLTQLTDLIGQGVEKSPFWQPIVNMPKEIGEPDRARFTAAYRTAIADKIVPAYKRLQTFLKKEYLPAARSAVGLSAYARGRQALQTPRRTIDDDETDRRRRSTKSASPKSPASRTKWTKCAAPSASRATCTRSSNICVQPNSSNRNRRTI